VYSAEFARIGKRFFAEHLVGANFGNISMRDGNGFYIKRTGAFLDVESVPAFVPLAGEAPKEASSEYRVHREVYRASGHTAIVHAHPPYAVALSLLSNEILPEDSEGVMFCPEIPVVGGAPGTQEIADNVAKALAAPGAKLVIVRGHGTFAAGTTLDEAYVYTSLAEHACKVIAIKRSFTRGM
jgi:L-fuculose-phosphate aldolase